MNGKGTSTLSHLEPEANGPVSIKGISVLLFQLSLCYCSSQTFKHKPIKHDINPLPLAHS